MVSWIQYNLYDKLQIAEITKENFHLSHSRRHHSVGVCVTLLLQVIKQLLFHFGKYCLSVAEEISRGFFNACCRQSDKKRLGDVLHLLHIKVPAFLGHILLLTCTHDNNSQRIFQHLYVNK